MPDPLIVQQMYAFRAALLREEAQQMQRMTARWLQLERSLDDSIEALLAEIGRRQAAGEQWARHTGPYARLEHYQTLLRQVRSEMQRFARYTEQRIDQSIAAHAEQGAEQAAWVLSGQTSRLNPIAVENIVAATQPAAPVGQLLAAAWPEAAVRMTDALVTGTSLGWNPRKTAAAMRQGLQSGFQRSLVIARTEQLRAWREASRATYQASGVVAGYKRLAAKSTRTCIACLLADGQFYALDQPFEEHPQGRCTLVPVLIGRDPPDWERGRQWLERQPPATQRQLLGPAAYNAWQAGDLRLEELVERHEHPTWGAALQVRSLRSVLGSEQAARWVQQATPTRTPAAPPVTRHQSLQNARLAEVNAMTPQTLQQLSEEIASGARLPKLQEHFRKHGAELADLGVHSPDAMNALFLRHIQRSDLRIFTYISTQPATQYRHWVLAGMDNGVMVLYNESQRKHWSLLRARDIEDYLRLRRGWWIEVIDWDKGAPL